MKRLVIKKIMIIRTVEFFYNMKLKGKQSRHRTKFVSKLQEHIDELQRDRDQLLNDFAEKDENGDFIAIDGKPVFNDQAGFAAELNDLLQEDIIIQGEEYEDCLDTVKNILINSEEEYDSENAVVYNILYELFNTDNSS